MEKNKLYKDACEKLCSTDVLLKIVKIKGLPEQVKNNTMTLDAALQQSLLALDDPYTPPLPSAYVVGSYTDKKLNNWEEVSTVREAAVIAIVDLISQNGKSGFDASIPFAALMKKAKYDPSEKVRQRAMRGVDVLLLAAADFDADFVVQGLCGIALTGTPYINRTAEKARELLKDTLNRLPEYKADTLFFQMAQKYKYKKESHNAFLVWAALVDYAAVGPEALRQTSLCAYEIRARKGFDTNSPAGAFVQAVYDRNCRLGICEPEDKPTRGVVGKKSRARGVLPGSFTL